MNSHTPPGSALTLRLVEDVSLPSGLAIPKMGRVVFHWNGETAVLTGPKAKKLNSLELSQLSSRIQKLLKSVKTFHSILHSFTDTGSSFKVIYGIQCGCTIFYGRTSSMACMSLDHSTPGSHTIRKRENSGNAPGMKICSGNTTAKTSVSPRKSLTHSGRSLKLVD